MESINVNLENLSNEERDQLMKLIDKSNRKKSRVFTPEDGDEFFIIDYLEWDGVSCYVWEDDEEDIFNYKIGNCYRTTEEASVAIERMKVLTELQRYADEHNESEIDWSICNAKHFISYDHEDCCLGIETYSYMEFPTVVYFASESTAKSAIDTIGANRIKKYIFNIAD